MRMPTGSKWRLLRITSSTNAGSRVLFLNPEVVVVTDADMQDLDAFVEKLRQPPFCVRIAHSQARRFVRRLWVARERAHVYPYNAPELL